MATVTTQERTNILKLVAGMFNAAPGATYLNEFTDAFVALNKDLGALANALGQTGAFKSLYPSFLSAEEFANKFLDTLGLKANTEAQDWVKAKVTAGESYASVVFQALVAIDASTAAEFKAAKDQLANKAAVAEYYSVEQNKSATDLAALQAVVAKVTNDAATVEAAKAGAAATAGKEFSLTEKVGEVVVGTAGNDTFNAVLGNTGAAAAAADSTLNIGDSIDGAAGEDTLNITLAGLADGTVLAGVVVKNVEKVFLTHTNNAALAAVAAGNLNHSGTYAGVKELWQVDTSAAPGTFGGVQVAADVVAGFKSTGTANAVAVAANTLVTGSATQKAISIAFDGVGTGSDVQVVGAALETVTLTGSVASNAAGANTAVLETVASVKTVNLGLTSNTTVTLDIGTPGDVAGIATVDLSKSTGNVTIDLSNAAFAAVKSVKGGAGNDTLTVDFDNNADKLAVDAGAGNDTVVVNATVAVGVQITNEGVITLGAGKDTLSVVNGGVTNISAAAVDATTLVENLITVTDFKTAEDVLNLNGGFALNTTQLGNINGAATLLAAVTAAGAITNGKAATADTVVFSWGGDAYVYSDNNQNGLDTGDGLIKLTGVDATQFTNIQNGNLVL